MRWGGGATNPISLVIEQEEIRNAPKLSSCASVNLSSVSHHNQGCARPLAVFQSLTELILTALAHFRFVGGLVWCLFGRIGPWGLLTLSSTPLVLFIFPHYFSFLLFRVDHFRGPIFKFAGSFILKLELKHSGEFFVSVIALFSSKISM